MRLGIFVAWSNLAGRSGAAYCVEKKALSCFCRNPVSISGDCRGLSPRPLRNRRADLINKASAVRNFARQLAPLSPCLSLSEAAKGRPEGGIVPEGSV